jgi:Flp pilus assembly pilin Flp
MKTFLARFVRDQAGAIAFEDALTAVSLAVGFAVAFALMNGTMVQLYATIFGMLTDSR